MPAAVNVNNDSIWLRFGTNLQLVALSGPYRLVYNEIV